jgi:signal transduction histidine kinase
VLVGWSARLPQLATFGSAGGPMRPNTALCLLLEGIALLVALHALPAFWRVAPAVLAASIAALTLSQDLLGYRAGIDTLLFPAERFGSEGLPGRMSPATASCLLLLGAALALLDARRTSLAQSCAALVALAATFILLGYLFDAPDLYRIGSFAPVAVVTAAMLLVLAVGVLAAQARRGWVAEFATGAAAAATGRRLAGLTLLLLPLLGWLRLQGEQRGWYDGRIGLALMVTTSMTLLCLLIWRLTRAANRAERRMLQLDRLYRTASGIDQLIVHCRDRNELLREAARIAREAGGFGMAWISMRDAAPASDEELPEFPPGMEAALIVNDIEAALPPEGWHAGALARDLRSLAALPIRIDSTVVGVFVFGSAHRNFFVGEELTLLHELTEDVGFALWQMALDVRRRNAEAAIQDLNARLAEQVTLRTAQLEATNAELEAFSYTISHDLRAPLRTIDGYSQLVEEDYGPQLDDMGRHLLRMVRNGSRRMGTLVDALLEFSRLGRQTLTPAPIRVADMVEEVWAEQMRQAPDRHIEFTLGPLPDVEADPALLREALTRLLANAVKYTSTRAVAAVEVQGHVQNGEVIYRVSDDGVGFDMQYASKLFQVFQRLHAETEFPGVGIGLAIVHRIIARHGGRVWVEARSDAGASFYFSLPRPVS